jgi:hypothetical protein
MEPSREQQVVIKFFKAGRTATETDEMVCAAYGDEALTRSKFFTVMDCYVVWNMF